MSAETGFTTQMSVSDALEDISLLDILDHVLNAGVLLHGSLVISLAGVDLVYVGLNVVITSVETALRSLPANAHSQRVPPQEGEGKRQK